ncbi:MAG: hypothetical protein WBC93_17125 [Sulfitobacter sp.]
MAVSDFLTAPIAQKDARAIPELLSFDRSRRFAFTFTVVSIISVFAVVPIISTFAVVPIVSALATIISTFAAVPIVATFAVIPTVTITSRAALGMGERRDKGELSRKVCFQTIRKDRKERGHQ